MILPGKLRKQIISLMVIGFVVLVGLSAFADLGNLVGAFRRLRAHYLYLLLIITVLNYLLRFLRWHYLLYRVDAVLPVKDSLTVFLIGLAMGATPGRAGELLRSYLVRQINGAPVSQTLPVIVGERISDAIGLLVLAVLARPVFPHLRAILGVMLLLTLLVIIAVQFRTAAAVFIDWLGRRRFLGRFAPRLRIFYQSSYDILSLRSLLVTALIGMVLWLTEGVMMKAILHNFAFKLPLLIAVFIFFISNVVGVSSMSPGGLGVTEGSMVGLLMLYGLPRDFAVATALLFRFAHMWLGVLLGLIVLLLYRGAFDGLGAELGSPKE